MCLFSLAIYSIIYYHVTTLNKAHERRVVMGLEIRLGRDGEPRKFWYGAYVDASGKRVSENLRIPIKGKPNPSGRLKDEGTAAFEASKAAAKAKLESLKFEGREKGSAAHLTERLIKARTGKAVEYVKIADLPERWRKLSRETPPSRDWLEWCDTIFKRFAAKTRKTFLYEVTQAEAAAYVESLRLDFTRRTASGVKSLLKSAFSHLLPPGMNNPFDKVISSRGANTEGGTTHRRPLTATELKALFETARPDPLLYPLAVCAACTGMRIGDVCQLQWQSVDLREGFIEVKTAKTGKSVDIPIFKPLREVLETALTERGASPYVWPHAASMYQRTRKRDGAPCRGYGITYRGKALFARAFASKEETPQDVPESGQIEAERPDLTKILPEVLEAVNGAGFAQGKQARIVDTLTRYARGESYREIEKATGRKRPIISQDLHDAELASKYRLRCGLIGAKGTTKKSGRDLKTLIKDTRQKHGDGERMLAASLLGWHSLRGTFVTLALGAGIPIETVGLITGHTLVETIRKFYNNPQREHLREVLGDKLPEVLTGNKPERIASLEATESKLDALAEVLNGLTNEEKRALNKLTNKKGGE